VGAAFLFAAGNNLQRHAAAKVPHDGYGPIRLIVRLLRSPRWLAGGACAVAGLLFQICALPAGGVILVQSVIASTLVFSLLLEALAERRRPSPVQLGGAVLVVAGTTVLIRLGRPGTGDSLASLWRLVPLWLAVAFVGGSALLRARYRPRGRRTAIVLGAAGGACFAIDAVFLRDLAETIHDFDGVRVAANVAGFALTSAVGNLAVQRGFHLAPLRHVLPAMAVAEPLAAFACGWTVFGERLQVGSAGLVVVPVGLSLMVAGVLACALNPVPPRCAVAAARHRRRSVPLSATDLAAMELRQPRLVP
jgi:drug/metabolite transporter (DMT)-like permease